MRGLIMKQLPFDKWQSGECLPIPLIKRKKIDSRKEEKEK
jgi:hypothetical protein